MNAESARRFPWVSFSLLLIAYACLGWLLATPTLTDPVWILPTCHRTFDLFRQVLPADQSQNVCGVILRGNLFNAALALSWIVIASIAFMSPLTSFNRFINRWFKSDTVAFLALCIIAGMVAFILLWLQLALHISTILASEALARIDIQTLGFSQLQAFWILVLLSSTGLAIGWVVRLWL
ncbi:MAG: hypothetical protein KME42_03975 [Tildeniella nuda ZEHNDER 1965/U140]|jgi:hypothetical protein|nr:hypothetical protein [Tildeniella nuda ZEHNDER 1965/U140]